MAEGSIVKRGNTYSIVYYVEGKQRWKTIGRVKKEAEKALRVIMGQVDRSEYSDAKIDFSRLVDDWLGSIKAQVKPSTLEFYATIGKHLKDYFKKRQVKAITTADVETYLAFKLHKLSNKTVGYHLGCLKQIFKKAQVWRYVHANPCDHLKRPKSEDKEIQLLSSEQIADLLNVTEGQTKMIILTALHSGLRAGEIAGLRWKAIDLVEGVLDITGNRSNYVRGEFTSPKSSGSRRKVIISPELVNELALWKEQATEELVFHNDGAPIEWIKFLHSPWARAIRDADLPKVSPHSLRHSYASILLAAGEQIAFISKQLGHSDIGVTLKVYSHLLPSAEIGAGQRIARAFENFLSKPLANGAIFKASDSGKSAL